MAPSGFELSCLVLLLSISARAAGSGGQGAGGRSGGRSGGRRAAGRVVGRAGGRRACGRTDGRALFFRPVSFESFSVNPFSFHAALLYESPRRKLG